MGNPVIHFEIGCRDLEKTGRFYSDLLGWKIDPNPPMAGINTDSHEGIMGHLVALGHEPHNFINVYARVENLENAIEKVQTLGGQLQVGPVPVAEMGRYAWITDPEGNRFGLWEDAAKPITP